MEGICRSHAGAAAQGGIVKRAALIITDAETLRVRSFDSGAFPGEWYAHMRAVKEQ